MQDVNKHMDQATRRTFYKRKLDVHFNVWHLRIILTIWFRPVVPRDLHKAITTMQIKRFLPLNAVISLELPID